jgi:hypothetical protein
VILGLDRLRALVGRREKDEAPAPGRPEADEQMDARIDAARTRLREQIDPRED